LKDWYDDWSATTREVITSRGDLIRLGLAKRRARTSDPAPAADVTPCLRP
jgi:hypothetical protein